MLGQTDDDEDDPDCANCGHPWSAHNSDGWCDAIILQDGWEDECNCCGFEEVEWM